MQVILVLRLVNSSDTMHRTQTETPDAVIVLANQMDPRGKLNAESICRAKLAVTILNEGCVPNIVTTGWDYRPDSDIKIAEAFKDYLVSSLGVLTDRVLTESNARDTVGDAIFTKINLAKPLAWRNIVVVTSDYHVQRTNEIFNFIYGSDFQIKVCGARVNVVDCLRAKEQLSTAAFRKTFYGLRAGSDLQILERLREHHPFYNGTMYPRIEKPS